MYQAISMKTVQHSVAKSTLKQQLQATSADKGILGVGLVMQSTQSPSRKEKRRNISRATQQQKYWEQIVTHKNNRKYFWHTQRIKM